MDKICEIIEPENELVNTPPRCVTRSIKTTSKSKVFGSSPPTANIVHPDSECMGMNNYIEDKGKRPVEDAAAFQSNKRKKFVIQHKHEVVYFVEPEKEWVQASMCSSKTTSFQI